MPGTACRSRAMYGGDLACGQLAAFAGLRALSNLDFEFVGMHQVVGSHTEAARSHLFHAVVGFALPRVNARIFPALAGIAAAAQPVHRDGQRAMRLRRNRAQRHGLRAEAAEQGGLGLDILDRDAENRCATASRSRMATGCLSSAIALYNLKFSSVGDLM